MALSPRFFVVHVIYLRAFSEIDPLVAPHREHLDRLVADGRLLLSGPLVPRTGGLLVMRGQDRTEVERALAEDPYHKAQVARYEVLEFSPVKFCDELRTLFGEG
ncbi:MAG: YciI family protein [Leptospirales bacterium]